MNRRQTRHHSFQWAILDISGAFWRIEYSVRGICVFIKARERFDVTHLASFPSGRGLRDGLRERSDILTRWSCYLDAISAKFGK